MRPKMTTNNATTITQTHNPPMAVDTMTDTMKNGVTTTATKKKKNKGKLQIQQIL